MDFMTIYKESFTFKNSTSQQQTRRHPDYSCKECTKSIRNKKKLEISDSQSNISNSGAGDKAQMRKLPNRCFCCIKEIGDDHKNRMFSSDIEKVCDNEKNPILIRE